MCGPGLTGLIVDQLLSVAVIRCDEHLSADLQDGVNDSSDTRVNGLDRLDGRRLDACMSDHIRVREIGDDHIILTGLDRLYEAVTDFRSTHLRLQVVGCNLRALDKDAVLTRIRFFNTAVEEERDMSVFLSLRDTGLRHVVLCKILAEGLRDLHLRECDLLVRDRYIIIGEAGIEDLLPRSSVKLVKIILDAEAAGDLTCAVRTEVEEDDGIAVLDGRDRLAVFHDYCRNNELVRNALLVRILDRLYAGSRRNAFTQRQRTVCLLNAVPAVVAVHRVISSGDHAKLTDADLIHLVLQLLRKLYTTLGRSITTVKESMYKDLIQPVSLRHLKQRVHMGVVAVDTAIGQQSVHMQLTVILLNILHSLHKDFIFEEISVLDRLGDAGKVLIHDSAGSHVQMADFRVAHLSVRQSYVQSACLSLNKGIFLHQAVHDRRIRQCDCIVFTDRIQSVAIKDH